MQDNIQPVCVPKFLAQPLPVDTEIFVTGYGKTAGGASMSLLKEIKLKVSSYTECLSTYESTLPVSGVFCATPVITGEDTCIGDGGSPALTYDTTTNKFTIVGINVGGSNDCSGLKPLVFIDITIYREWLRKTSNGCCDLLGSRLG
uniref:Mucin-5AC n=1 Tax=Phallusia mammillata TaxID=59560 RepID=A0A6F9DLS0_9ASCI|nr:mucin-5AC [Phallusia mammillata]